MPASADTHCSQPSFLNTELVNYEIVLDYDSDRAHEKLLLHSNETSGDSLDTNTGGNNEIISAESGVTMSADKTGSEQYCKNIEFSLPEKKDKRNMKHHSQTLKPELSEGTDLTSDNSDFPLSQLIAQCDLDMFEDDELYGIDGSSVASVLRESLTRLYFSKELRLGGVTLPRNVFFPVLRSLDCTILGSALERFTTRPKNKIRNPIAYLSAVIYNSITEDDALFLGTYHVCSGSSITQRHSRTLTVTPYEPNDSMLQDWKNLCTTQVFGSRLEAIN